MSTPRRFSGEALQAAREARRLSRLQLAALALVARQTVWNYERGGAVPSCDVAWRLAAALRVPLGQLGERAPRELS